MLMVTEKEILINLDSDDIIRSQRVCVCEYVCVCVFQISAFGSVCVILSQHNHKNWVGIGEVEFEKTLGLLQMPGPFFDLSPSLACTNLFPV